MPPNATMVRLIEATKDELRRGRKDADLTQLENNGIRLLTEFWRMQTQDFMKKLAELRGEFRESPSSTRMARAWDDAIERSTTRMMRGMRKEIEEGLRRGAASAMTDLGTLGPQMGIGFNLKDPRVQAWIDQRVNFLADSLNATSHTKLVGLIDQLDARGLTYNQITKEVRAEMKSWYTATKGTETRAQLTAFTELGTGYEQGRTFVAESFEKAGVQLEKRWVGEGDKQVCDICLAAIVDDWIPRQALFANGFQSPLGHPGCRCDMELSVVDQSAPGQPAATATDADRWAKAKDFSKSKDDASLHGRPATRYNWRGQPKGHNMYKKAQTRNSLNLYVEDSDDINRFLRSGADIKDFKMSNWSLEEFNLARGAGSTDASHVIRAIDDAINMGAPTKEDLIMWRGVATTRGPVDLIKAFGKNPEKWVGRTYTDKAFGSMSLSRDIAEGFMDSYIFKVHTPKGTRVISGLQWEAEYIAKRGQKYRVLGATKEVRKYQAWNGRKMVEREKVIWQIDVEMMT